MKSYAGLLLGFGVLGGIGMGLGYAAATPAAVKWFGPHRRGLVVGLVVGGYGGAAIYIAPLAKYLIANHGLSGSFLGLGALFAVVVIVAGGCSPCRRRGTSPRGFRRAPPGRIQADAGRLAGPEMLRTWQFYGLVFLFIGSAQSGLLVIANATPMLNQTASALAFFAANAWLLASFGGLVNATGRIGTGLYSDRIGRANAYLINGVVSAACLFLMPTIMASGSVLLLFLAVGRGLLAVRRRAGADAGLHGRLLRPEEPGVQLRPGLHRLGHRVLRPAARRATSRTRPAASTPRSTSPAPCWWPPSS